MSLILAVNAGSSSLKISLYKRVADDPKTPCLLLTSTISSISSPPAKVTFQHVSMAQASKHRDLSEPSIHDHESAFIYFLDRLKEDVSVDRQQVEHICHRVVHGGDYTEPTIISKQSYHHIETLSDLAPLHNAAALSVMNACLKALPHARSIAFFDTAFHKDLPVHVSTYAINQDVARKRGLRKYGFHGLSCRYIHQAHGRQTSAKGFTFFPETYRVLTPSGPQDEDELNIIALHLGSGASVSAIRGGKSIDTSMGLTPLSGLPGATRAGDIDPSLIFHYMSEPLTRLSYDSATTKEMHVTQAEQILNSQSGWKALAGTTDFREITEKADFSAPPTTAAENPYALAFHVVLDRVLHYVGAYHLALRGDVDALVFAGGIGERSRELRSAVGEAVINLGYSVIDEHVNQELDQHAGSVIEIGKRDHGGKRVLVCRTDEQLEMARECSLAVEFWD